MSRRSPAAKALPGPELKALKAKSAEAINAELAAAGYPTSADPAKINMPLLIAVLLLFVVAATALYGPQAAALVEMFPTRIRYTAMSLPYHVGTGWVGGFLPVTSFAIVALTGDIFAGLWYAVAFTALSAVVTICLPEGNARQAAGGVLAASSGTSECRSAARLRPARGRSAASTTGRPRSPARAIRFFCSPRDGDQHGPRREDRGAGQGHARDRRFPGSGSGITPTACRALGALSASSRSGPAKIEAVWPSLPTPSQTRSGGELRSCKLGVGRIAGQLIVGNVAGDREDPRAAGRKAWAMARTFECSSVIGTSRSSLGMIVTFFQLSLASASLAIDRQRRLAARERDQRLVAGIDRAFDDEADVAGDRVRHLVDAVIFPPFGFDHCWLPCRVAGALPEARRKRPALSGRPTSLLDIAEPGRDRPAVDVGRGTETARSSTSLQVHWSIAGMPIERLILQSVARPLGSTRTAMNTAPPRGQ